MSYFNASSQFSHPSNLVYSDHVYQTTFAHPSTHVPARMIPSQSLTTPLHTRSYNIPVTLRQESPVLETPPRPHVQKLSYSQIIPQTVSTGYQPVYQVDYERDIRNSQLVHHHRHPHQQQQIQQQQQQQNLMDSVYSDYQARSYTPIQQVDHERIAEQEYILQAERQKEVDYLNWKESQLRSRSPISSSHISAPSRPLVPLASSYVLQPGAYSDIKQNISNYENSLLDSLNTQEKFKQMKEDMNKASYTYSQMISTVLYNFKEILLALKEIEKCKNDLISREDFNIHLFYNALNSKDSNKPMTSDQLRAAMKELNFSQIDIYDIELLFSKYSNERSADYLSLNDFKKLFIPYYINHRRKYEFDSREDQQEISIETQRIGARVIKMHLSLENSQEYYRQLMFKRLIDLAYCFDYIDRERRGVLNLSQMQTFLQGNDIYFNAEDLNLLIQRFNKAFPIGPQLEHVIKLNEFMYELSPKSRIPYLKE